MQAFCLRRPWISDQVGLIATFFVKSQTSERLSGLRALRLLELMSTILGLDFSYLELDIDVETSVIWG